ncbi:hypothetical protein C7441_11462 [Pseudaminobacter salicylatoxidans]|uniref:Uncharacterized protein n=1 Tax=Pseudaminobacter salicylatoxidans TaxID=93369 RepID=A0A316C389_PSESE|nr:hypothetical protein [Pseudaminobacter salicylatoxidans]PWJ79785.1 hypothetical protein C7441_11462 [Pseudaminobacter salicylatoxidans]
MTTWTSRAVKEEMIRAFEVLFETTGPVGPDWFKNSWPEYRVSFEDEVGQHAQGTQKKATRVRVQRTAREISSMEKVLLGIGGQPSWGSYLRDQPGLLRTLVAWCFWEIKGRHTEAECQRRGWAYSTFRRRRDNAAARIAEKLNETGVEVW